MKNRFSILVITASILINGMINIVYAEHQKAQEYREILNSNTYMIEYSEMDENKNDDLNLGKIIVRDNDTYLTAERAILPNTLGFFGNLEKKLSYTPIAFYENRKYYAFLNDKSALSITEDIMKQKNYYAGIDWHNIVNILSVPNMFLPIMGDNIFNKKDEKISKPVYELSRTEIINNKIYSIDEYLSDVKNVANKVVYRFKYSYFYKDNEIAWIRISFVDLKGNEKIKQQVKINKISNELPDKIYKCREDIMVTDLGQGDINELLGNNKYKKEN